MLKLARIDVVHLTFCVVRVAVVVVVAEEKENMLVLSIYTQANIIDVVVDSSGGMFSESDERVQKIGRSLLSSPCCRRHLFFSIGYTETLRCRTWNRERG